MRTEDLVRQIQSQLDNLLKAAVAGSLLLIDLADSTRFKTRHPYHDWLARLFAFRETVKISAAPVQPLKFLGDGALCFFPVAQYPRQQVCEVARTIMGALARVSAERNYIEEFALRCRIIMDFGDVFMFDDTDPQGTPVDRLFRLEKYVPRGSIGITEEFRNGADLPALYSLGRYLIRGIGGGRHELFLLDAPTDDIAKLVEGQREVAALTDIWSLGHSHDGPIFVVGGRIPETDPETNVVQSGDKDALVQSVLAIARAGRMDDVRILTGAESQEHYLRENIVAIGGPYHNPWTLRLMREVGSPLIFGLSMDDIPLINQVDGRQFLAIRRGNKVVRDYGFVARLRNPLNREKHIVIVCGIETFGVLGAAQLLTGLEKNAHFLRLHERLVRDLSTPEGGLRDFFLMSGFAINEEGVVLMDTLDAQLSGLTSDWSGILDVRRQEDPPDEDH